MSDGRDDEFTFTFKGDELSGVIVLSSKNLRSVKYRDINMLPDTFKRALRVGAWATSQPDDAQAAQRRLLYQAAGEFAHAQHQGPGAYAVANALGLPFPLSWEAITRAVISEGFKLEQLWP